MPPPPFLGGPEATGPHGEGGRSQEAALKHAFCHWLLFPGYPAAAGQLREARQGEKSHLNGLPESLCHGGVTQGSKARGAFKWPPLPP